MAGRVCLSFECGDKFMSVDRVFVALEEEVVDIFDDAWASGAVGVVGTFDAVEVLVEGDMTCTELSQNTGLSAVETIGGFDEAHGR